MTALLTVLKQHFHEIKPQKTEQFEIIVVETDALCVLDEKVS